MLADEGGHIEGGVRFLVGPGLVEDVPESESLVPGPSDDSLPVRRHGLRTVSGTGCVNTAVLEGAKCIDTLQGQTCIIFSFALLVHAYIHTTVDSH